MEVTNYLLTGMILQEGKGGELEDWWNLIQTMGIGWMKWHVKREWCLVYTDFFFCVGRFWKYGSQRISEKDEQQQKQSPFW